MKTTSELELEALGMKGSVAPYARAYVRLAASASPSDFAVIAPTIHDGWRMAISNLLTGFDGQLISDEEYRRLHVELEAFIAQTVRNRNERIREETLYTAS